MTNQNRSQRDRDPHDNNVLTLCQQSPEKPSSTVGTAGTGTNKMDGAKPRPSHKLVLPSPDAHTLVSSEFTILQLGICTLDWRKGKGHHTM